MQLKPHPLGGAGAQTGMRRIGWDQSLGFLTKQSSTVGSRHWAKSGDNLGVPGTYHVEPKGAAEHPTNPSNYLGQRGHGTEI